MIRQLAGALVLVACGGGSKAVPVGSQLGPALTAALAAADQVRAPWRCAAPDGPHAADTTIAVGTHTWKLAGHTLAREGKASELVIGAIADAGGSAPETLGAIGRLRTKLARADLVLVLGGMGTTQAELEGTLGVLGDRSTFLIVALPGDLEAVPALTAATTSLRARGVHLLDGRLIHRIEVPGVSIAAIGGAGARGRLVAADDGCAYRESDVSAALIALTARPGIRIVASAEAPRSVRDGEAIGELALTAGAGHEIDVALHGPLGPGASRSRTGSRTGDAESLTPGTVDATPRLPGPATAPTAGLLTVSGHSWTWKPITDSE
ncbi:MAG: hypothetical protein H0T42_28175 [Deltaproteobacteria bacterium]|nr:hypothetical protein [Deltaproteobacteria bacterium]